MKSLLTAAIRDEIQGELDRAARKYRTGFGMQVGTVRPGDGVFQVDVHATRQGVHTVQLFPVLALVGQELEDRFPGLRVMLLPAEPARSLVRRLRGFVKRTSRPGSAKKKSS
ncbi:MAG: hypothetical protein HYX51_01075 [Chloroflexi bacterium]|nr:hypothetical protein [Chloroflexota bacterium]